MSDITLGTIYSMNKELVLKNEKRLTSSELRDAIRLAAQFMTDTKDYYYMLLCHEEKDYTIFKTNQKEAGNIYNASVLINEILSDRGEIRCADLDENKAGIEFWVVRNEEAFCYMFFPCGACVIDEV